ncbi:hypothetical protein PNOK_0225900 [Pyrrhoderma noxium]|uniref:Copper acquisition factor BIM1-like domain-containing protein n=1 Tax=Pyrrhoderma noxium TaxID=2282107 RepID=A0A286URX2_9AGAM|nr:hypothetical protein PNOK_0225900 [Pyrrhoderma noxium]
MALLSFIAMVSAHYRIQYPEPRGTYESEAQLTFCDGYTDATGVRSDFPLGTGGLIQLNNSHSHWTAAVLISVEQNPSSFEDFNQTSDGTELPLAVSWFSTEGAGSVCIPVDIESLGISGIGDGSNVTLQTMLTGGDGNLFQCVDLTLRKDFSVPSNITCTRTVNGTVDTAVSSSDSDSSTSTSSAQKLVTTISGFLGIALAAVLI